LASSKEEEKLNKLNFGSSFYEVNNQVLGQEEKSTCISNHGYHLRVQGRNIPH